MLAGKFWDTTPADIILLKVNSGSNRRMSEIFSKLTIETAYWRHWRRSGDFIVNFDSHNVQVLPLLTLNK